MKKSSTSSGTFGAPKPLPGQAGYKVTETEILKKEADEMESRLLMLQERMKQQQLESAENSAKAGGSGKWKSARTEKGSIRAYGKEVNDKVKKRLENDGGGDPTLRATASIRRPTRPTVGLDFKSKDVGEWNVSDVSAWLTEVQFPQYVSAFAQNAITGSVLLDITGEDLDYMEIKILGHRKIILKAVEEFRQSRRYNGSAGTSVQKMPEMLRTSSNPNMSAGGNEKDLMSKSMQVAGSNSIQNGGADERKEVKATHWSQLEPLANNKVSNPRGGGFVNPADGESGSFLDEAAERQAFMDAVAEWRKADGDGAKQPVRIEREYLSGPAEKNNGKKPGNSAASVTGSTSTASLLGVGGGGAGDGMWKNPFGAPGGSDEQDQESLGGGGGGEVLDEAAERRAFQEAVMEWRRGPSSVPVAGASSSSSTTASTTTAANVTSRTAAASTTASPGKSSHHQLIPSKEGIDLDDSFASDGGTNSPKKRASGGTGGGDLYTGELNEEAEHAEFVKAVDAWRSRDPNAPPGKGGSSASTVSQAEKLGRELEQEREAMALKIRKQKEEAERRLQEASRELNKLRSARPLSAVNDGGKCSDGTNEGAAVEVDDDDDLSDKGGAVYTYQIAPCAHSPQSSPYKYSPRGGESEISPRVVSSAPTSRERRILVEEEEVFFPPTIAVALVESVLGASTSDGKDGAEEDYYVVEVDSDEE